MYWEERQRKCGDKYFSFAYYDKSQKKTIRLKNSEVPSGIDSVEKAEEFCKAKEAEHEAAKIRIKRKLEWKTKFYDFDGLYQLYRKDMQKKAPNTWENSCYFLEQYVFPFFLTEKQCNNINNWSLFYQEFIDWLLEVKPVKGPKDKISYSTRNHIITALNNFMVIMKRRNKIERVDKCQKFSSHLIQLRDIDDVFTDDEIKKISKKLIEKNQSYDDLFKVLLNTGLRIGECLALSVDDFFVGKPEHEVLRNSLEKHNISTFGYLSVESQLGHKTKVRDESGNVMRKPLKGRRSIKSGSGRIIPITDKDVFNILAKRFNAQLVRLNAKEYGTDGKDYLLFDGIRKNSLGAALSEIYSKMGEKYKAKSPHCCRHTFSTRFVGETCGDFFLAKAILGHKDVDTTMRYVHIFEAINRKVRKSEMKRIGVDLI